MSDHQDLANAILTMDVVDELRHRDVELAEVAKRSYGHEELKARLAEIYRAQGIEVPDAVLEAGIQAQRDQRFIYVAPSGVKARLANLWIKRALVGQAVAGVFLAVAGLFSGYHFGVAMPAEKRAAATVAELSGEAALFPDRVIALSATFEAANDRFNAAVAAATQNKQAGRLAMAVTEAEAAHRPLAASISDALAKSRAQDSLPALTRADGATRFAGAVPGWVGGQKPEAAMRSRLDAMSGELDQVSQDIQVLDGYGARLERAVATSNALENANAALLATSLQPQVDVVRSRYYAAGDAALRATKLQDAADAAARLARLRSDAEAVTFIVSSLRQLRQTARETGVAGADLKEIEAMEAQVTAANGVESVRDAEDALKRLQVAVATLQGSYTYRVVNRRGEKSGVWRYHEDSRRARNHYLVIEALDDNDKAAALAIRNEETGETELVSIFAVRVPEEEYVRVSQDKMDNGIIDDDIVALKKPGALTPEFAVQVAGGYITKW